jgi:tetratricopeptide (TPR) repeat protein
MWLGNLYYQKGDLEKAKHYYERALKIQKEQFGPDHVNVAKVYYNNDDLEKA